MKCLSCDFYDKNDPVHCYGTCELQDEDFRCDHECNFDLAKIEKQQLGT